MIAEIVKHPLLLKTLRKLHIPCEADVYITTGAYQRSASVYTDCKDRKDTYGKAPYIMFMIRDHRPHERVIAFDWNGDRYDTPQGINKLIKQTIF